MPTPEMPDPPPGGLIRNSFAPYPDSPPINAIIEIHYLTLRGSTRPAPKARWMPSSPKLLYVGSLARGTVSKSRFLSLQRLLPDAEVFDLAPFTPTSRLWNALRIRLPIGPLVSKVNRALVETVRKTRPDIVWFHKPIYFTAETLLELKQLGAQLVCYNMDNPFGPRNDPGWMQFKRVYRLFDLHCVFRNADVARYRAWNLPFVKLIPSYEPSLHFPPPATWTDANRDRQVSFIGSPYEERPAFLRQLSDQFQLPLAIAGPRWEGIYPPSFARAHLTGGMLMDEEYTDGLWRSRVNLAFITRLNEDDVAHKTFEIAACGQFLLACRSEEHMAMLTEDSEAAYFSTVEECASKARFYLERPEVRQRFGERAHQRSVRSGYDNDTQLAKVLARLGGKA